MSGLNIVKTLVGIPAFSSANELVLPASRFLELPRSTHPFLRLAQRIGRYHSVSDGLVMLIGSKNVEECILFKVLTERLHNLFGTNEQYIIERLDIRLRGALILFIVEPATQKSFICRLLFDPTIQTVVRRNHDFLTLIRQALIDQKLVDKLPMPILELKYGQITVFVETVIEGVLAWKINDVRFHDIIFRGAYDFITRFQTAMRQARPVPGVKLKELLEPDLRKLHDCLTIKERLWHYLQTLGQRLFELAAGKHIYLTASHGDYGYGNILVNPETGRLSGIIDWDTGRLNDLPGIDYLNFLVQKYRSETGCGVAEAFITVCGEVLQRGELDGQGFYAAEFNLVGDLLKIILYCSCVRYMSRAAQYPDVFVREQSDYCKIMIFFQDKVPL